MPRMTHAEFLAYQTRRFADAIRGPQDTDCPTGEEATLHDQIIDECQRRGWIALYSARHRPTTRKSGEPDFSIIADGGRTFYVECKTRDGKMSEEQNQFAVHAGKLGHMVYIVRSLADFLAVCK